MVVVMVVTIMSHLYWCLLYARHCSAHLPGMNSFNNYSKLQDWSCHFPISVVLRRSTLMGKPTGHIKDIRISQGTKTSLEINLDGENHIYQNSF